MMKGIWLVLALLLGASGCRAYTDGKSQIELAPYDLFCRPTCIPALTPTRAPKGDRQ